MPRGVRRIAATPAAAAPAETPAVVTEEESFAEEIEEIVEAPLAVKVDAAPVAPHDEGVDLPFSDGEVILKQRTDDEAILWVVTNFGRKVRIEPSGAYEVVTGPLFNQEAETTPNQPETE